MSLIVGIPALIALYVYFRRGVVGSFLNVYVPVLLLLPEAFRWKLSGQLSFNESAMVPVAVFYLLTSWREWEWSVMDFLVAALAGIMSLAEYIDRDFHEARNVALHAILTLVFPYMLAKGILRREVLWVGVAKRITVILAIVAIVGVFELVSGINPFVDLLSPLFPDQPYDADFVRFGLVRTTGPYAHAILAGLILAAGYRIARWLDWSNLWPDDIDHLRISKVHLCELLIVMGSILTLSRGPWIAAGVASLIVNFSLARNRKRAFAIAVAMLILFAVPVYYMGMSYVSANRATVTSEPHLSATYRYEMIGKYASLVEQRPIWGWGRAGFSPIRNLASIDNDYLLVALSYGVFAAALLSAVMLSSSSRLFVRGIRLARDDPAAMLMFSLLGAQVVVAVSIATAWLGAQTPQFLFLILGWSEGVLQVTRERDLKHSVQAT